MCFQRDSITYLIASFAHEVIRKCTLIGMSKAIIDGHTALTFTTVGLFLDERGKKICCCKCNFTSSLLLDTHEILGKHFSAQKACCNNVKIKHFVFKKLLLPDLMELGIFGNFNGTLIENGESVEVMETSTIEQFSEAEVLSFDIDGLPKDDVERKKLADFKYVNPDDLPTVTPGSFRSESKDSLPRKIGVNQDAQGNWTCESCHWASPINHNLEEFVHQHSLFSPVCSHPEQKADFETKGVIVSTQYRPLSKRVFSKNTSLGTVLCYLKQPKLVGGVEVVQLFLFWENLTVSKETRTFLQEVYLIVGKLEQLHEIKFVIPLRTKDMPDEFGTEKLKNGHVGRLTPKSSNFDMCNSWAVMVQKRDKYISSIACGLCFDSSDLYINLGCGHVMLCFQCILRLPQSHKTCPICRTSLSAVQKFHSKCVETSVVPPGRNVSEMLNGSVF